MSKQFRILYFFVICWVMNGCGSHSVKRPTVLVDVEQYTSDGIHAYTNAEWSKAEHFFYKAFLLYQGIDNQEGVLLSTINLAEVSLAVHNNTESEHYLTQAVTIAKMDGLQRYRPRIVLLSVLNALQQNKVTEAVQLLQDILPVFDGDTVNSTLDTIQLAAVASRTRVAFLKQQDAVLWTERYANALQKTVNKSMDSNARLLRFQADLVVQQGADNEAERNMLEALSIYKKSLSRSGIAVTLLELGQYYRLQHRWQEAEDYLNRSKAVYSFLGDDGKVKLITDILSQIDNKVSVLF